MGKYVARESDQIYIQTYSPPSPAIVRGYRGGYVGLLALSGLGADLNSLNRDQPHVLAAFLADALDDAVAGVAGHIVELDHLALDERVDDFLEVVDRVAGLVVNAVDGLGPGAAGDDRHGWFLRLLVAAPVLPLIP